MSSKNICVIGAGLSGLVAIKTCLEEGHNVTCYDKTNSIGGLWKYREEVTDGVGSVMKSTIINTSKEMSAFSDFPPPKHFPNYMHNTLYWRYLENYATNFRLLPYIHLSTEVLRVEKAEDYISTGKWQVTIKTQTDDIKKEIYDGVMLCSGHHAYPNTPQFPGLDTFQGKVMHTHDYRLGDEFRDKRVLVVGFGNSGCDVAVELSHIAKEVYLSTRRGAWLLSRIAEGGLPTDVKFKTRLLNYVMHYLAPQIKNFFAEFKANLRFDHATYSIKPKHRFFSQHPTINDELPTRIISGFVTIKDDVHKFTESGVIFSDDCTIAINIDAVIFATGYEIKYPFLESNVIEQKRNQVTLYKYVFPPQLKHPTLAVVGLLQVLGALPSLSEIQCRWIARVFKNTCSLPTESVMKADIDMKRWELSQHYVNSDRHTVEVDYIWYQDEIARLIGAKPDFRYMLFSDPELFWSCFVGPMVPYTYRLVGPHSWKGARDAILTTKQRILAPLQTRSNPESLSQPTVLENLFVCPIFLITVAVIITIFLLV